jgi:hypothetical protein
MGKNRRPSADTIIPANDSAGAADRVGAVVVTLARLLGRQIAREQFRPGLAAANDNADSPSFGEP